MDASRSRAADEAAVRDLLARVNDAWLHERGDALTLTLNRCFTEDVVMRGPAFALLGRGREFAVQSYHDFVAQAAVISFSAERAEVDILGANAVAQYEWTMTYSLAAQEYTERGHDVFVLSRSGDKWLISWRALLPEPV